MAQALADEWFQQPETIKTRQMRLNGLVNTALDEISPQRPKIEKQLLDFGETDTLCYRVSTPLILADQQEQAWQPLLDWAENRFDCALKVTTSLLPITQSQAALIALRQVLSGFDIMRLAALQLLASRTHSLILALAVAEKRLDPDTAHELARLDQIYQAQFWGEAPETSNHNTDLLVDLRAATRFLQLLE